MSIKWLLAVVLVMVALGGCLQRVGVPEGVAGGVPLLVDADFDAAVVALPGARLVLEGAELEELRGWQEVREGPLDDGDGALGPRATLPDAVGTVAFVRHNPNLSANPWTVHLMDQAADVTTMVYGGRREIDSVAVSADANVLLLAMRRTIDASGDFEVYRVTLDADDDMVERLTVTPYDERNVSMSGDASVLVWEGEDGDGKRAVFVREGDTEAHLALALEQYEPSISADGNTIALVRTLANGNPRVVRYEREGNSYQVLWGQTAPVTLSHPSPSADGSKVAFLEYRPEGTAPSERQLVRYLDTVAQTVTNAVGVQLTDGPRIAHPHLAADGDHLAYAWRQGDAWNVFTRRVSTRETQRIAVSMPPTSNHAPYWAQATEQPGVVRVTIDQGDQTLPLGGSITLTATVEVQGDTSQAVTWTSDDDTIASIDTEGIVTAVSEGITIITATSVVDESKSDSVTITVTEPVEHYWLEVDKAGSGTGTVTSSPLGINCGDTCEATFEQLVEVTLTASPADGSFFVGWSGFAADAHGCTGTDPCTVQMLSSWVVTATFNVLGSSISGNVEYSEVWPSGGPTADTMPVDSGWLADGKAITETVGAPPATAMRGFDSGPAWEVGNWATATPGFHYMPSEIIVGFRDDLFSVRAHDAWTLSANQVAVLGAELQAAAATFATDYGLSVRSATPILRVALMRFPSNRELVDVMAQLASDPRVAYVEPNGIYRVHSFEPKLDGRQPRPADAAPAATHPSDPLYPNQAWHYSYVGAQRGWDTQRGSDTVRVAVIDSGYRPDHPDRPYYIADEYDFVDFDPSLSWHYYQYCSDGSITKPRAWDETGYDDNATEWMSYRYNGALGCLIEPNPSGSHGMHVIGTIGADWWNTGGVGLNRDVTIIPIQALDLAGGGTWIDVANAVLYAGGLASAPGVPTITRADIINMSLGGPSSSTTLANAVTAASNAGSLIIAAAGNAASSTQRYPAAYPEVVAVTAIGGGGALASYSSFGSWVELTAPGGDFQTFPFLGVWSTTFDYSGCSTTPTVWCYHGGDGEANWAAYEGTSMAAPHVSGIAALYKAHDPSLDRAQLRQALRDLAVDWGTAGFNDEYGYGLAHVRPGVGVARVNSTGGRRVQLIDATTGATVQSVTTNAAGDYTFTGVPNGSYYVLAASSGSPTWTFGATGASISAYSAGDDGWFQGATPVTLSNADLTGIDIRLGFPGYQTDNGTPATAAFMHPAYYAVITYDHNLPDRWFRIRVPHAGNYRIWTDGFNSPDRCGAGTIDTAANRFGDFDTVIELYESDGTTLIAANDDAPGRGLCSELDQSLAAGTYLVKVRAWGTVSTANDDRRTILRFDPP